MIRKLQCLLSSFSHIVIKLFSSYFFYLCSTNDNYQNYQEHMIFIK